MTPDPYNTWAGLVPTHPTVPRRLYEARERVTATIYTLTTTGTGQPDWQFAWTEYIAADDHRTHLWLEWNEREGAIYQAEMDLENAEAQAEDECTCNPIYAPCGTCRNATLAQSRLDVVRERLAEWLRAE